MKQTLCFDCLNIYFVSTLATLLPVKSNGSNKRNAWAFVRAFMVVCIFDKGVKGQCLSFNLVPNLFSKINRR